MPPPEHQSKDVRSFKSLSAGRNVRKSKPCLKLFCILKQAGCHCEKELCPGDSVSVLTKAKDVVRNLTSWKTYLDELVMQGVNTADFVLEQSAYREVMAVATETVEFLESGDGNGINEKDVEQRLYRFKSSLMSVIQRLEEMEGTERKVDE